MASTCSTHPTTPDRARPSLSTASELQSAADTNNTSSVYDDVSESVDLDGQSVIQSQVTTINTTPSTARTIKTTHQWDSLNEEIKKDLFEYQSSGIEPADFLRITFNHNKAEYGKLEERAKNIVARLSGRDDFDHNLGEFRSAIRKLDEAGMYEPLVNMGNMILGEAESKDQETGSKDQEDGHKVRLWYLKEKHLVGTKGEIKPDLVLIPEVVRDRVSALQEEENEQEKEKEKRNGKKKEVVESDEEGKKEVVRNVEEETTPKDGEAARGHPVAREEDEEKSDLQNNTPSRVHVGEVLTVFECKARPNAKERDNAIPSPITSNAGIGSSGSRVSNTSAGRKRAASPTPVSGVSSNKKPRILVRGSGQSAGKKKVKKSQRLRNKRPDNTPAPAKGTLQLARYMMEMLSARGDRKFAVGVRLNAHQMSFSFYNRAGIVETKAFDLCSDQKYLFAMFLLMFQRHPTTYGFNSITGYRDPFDLENKETWQMNIADALDPKYNTFDQSLYSSLKLEDALSSEFCLIGRGSTVFKVSPPMDSGAPTMAIKFSWQESSRRNEIENILDARKILKNKYVLEAYGYADLKDDSPGKALYDACAYQKSYKERRLRILVMKCYHTLAKIKDSKKFRKLIIQLVEALHLLSIGGMLHRDISIGNLAYEEVDGELSIIILDFELAVKLDANGNGKNSVRTGTAPFMAREVLDGFSTQYTHGIEHDLESVFYVIVWHAVGYRGSLLPEKSEDHLRSWRKGDYKEMRSAKDDFIADGKSILAKITDEVLWNWVYRLWMKYNMVATDLDALNTNLEKEKSAASNAIVEALNKRMKEEQFSESTYKILVIEQTEALEDAMKAKRRASRITISFSTWMDASLAPISFEHSLCNCCEK